MSLPPQPGSWQPPQQAPAAGEGVGTAAQGEVPLELNPRAVIPGWQGADAESRISEMRAANRISMRCHFYK